jgi:hypothetical protein
MSRLSILRSYLFLAIYHSVAVYATENSIDSPQDAIVGWQADAPRRGTLDIIWNCIFTILACTWNVQYLNIPEPNNRRWETLRQAKWTVLTILFPEILLAHALVERKMVAQSKIEMENCPDWPSHCRRQGGPNDGKPEWTLQHSYYANMGGFHLFMKRTGKLDHVLNRIRRAFGIPDKINKNNDNCLELCTLTAKQLEYCLKNEQFFSLPDPWVTKEEILDKSKSDYFTIGVTVVQVGSLVISLITRWARDLRVSQLEVVTFVFSLCALFLYLLRYNKPQGIKTPTKIWFSIDERDLHLLEGICRELQGRAHDHILDIMIVQECGALPKFSSRVRNDNIPRKPRQKIHNVLSYLSALAIPVGGLHLIAWDYKFPTTVERILWITSSFLLASLPPVICLIMPTIRLHWWHLNTSQFMRDGLIALRGVSKKRLSLGTTNLVESSTRQLMEVIDSKEHQNYHVIFKPSNPEFRELKNQIMSPEGRPKGEIEKLPDPRFYRKFGELDQVMQGMGREYGPEADKTDFFPPANFGQLSLAFIIAVVVFYCLVRLMIISLAFSTLRAMPDSVYETTWVDVIPNVT